MTAARPALLALALAMGAPAAWAQQPLCQPDPLAGRALYLRGSFNGWSAPEAQRFTWLCNRWELVTRISGEHRFKVGDEGWSADADLGSTDGRRLVPRGPDIQRRFSGTQRITIAMASNTPELQVDGCPADGEAPLGSTTLFLRGTLNNWAALDEYAFQYSCDAYYLNVDARGRHEFKIADAAWTPAATIAPGAGNFTQTFSGAHTLRLAWAGGKPQLSVGPRSFADPRAQPVADPVALSLRFDSRNAADKSPFGALPAGSTVHYAVSASPGVQRLTLVVEKRRLLGNQEVLEYAEAARVPMRKTAAGGQERWTASHRYDEGAVYGYWFEPEIGGGV